MNTERTLAIVKPDAVEKGLIGEIVNRIEKEGFRIVGMKMLKLKKETAEAFYYVHKDKYFFPLLCEFMMTGPVVVMVLESEDAVARWRAIMGPTDSTEAGPETVRGKYGESVRRNAVHGSDCIHSAAFEIPFFFSGSELL